MKLSGYCRVFVHPTVSNRQKTFSDRCKSIGIQCQKLNNRVAEHQMAAVSVPCASIKIKNVSYSTGHPTIPVYKHHTCFIYKITHQFAYIIYPLILYRPGITH